MPIPQVTDRIKEAPAVVLRAVFAGIGQVLMAVDKIRAQMEQATSPAEADQKSTAGRERQRHGAPGAYDDPEHHCPAPGRSARRRRGCPDGSRRAEAGHRSEGGRHFEADHRSEAGHHAQVDHHAQADHRSEGGRREADRHARGWASHSCPGETSAVGPGCCPG